MNLFGIKLRSDKAHVLTNTRAAFPLFSGAHLNEYKILPIENKGVFLSPHDPTLAGMVFSNILSSGSRNFDEITLDLPDLIKIAKVEWINQAFALGGKEIPASWTADQTIEAAKHVSPTVEKTFQSDFYLVGYSEKSESMAMVVCLANLNHKTEIFSHTDYPGFYLFPSSPALNTYVNDLRRNPESVDELVTCLKITHDTLAEDAGQDKEGLSMECDRIQMTTVFKDGCLKIEDLGPLNTKDKTCPCSMVH